MCVSVSVEKYMFMHKVRVLFANNSNFCFNYK